jgi:peptidoglycan-N-acetylglucosamine deacetylase
MPEPSKSSRNKLPIASLSLDLDNRWAYHKAANVATEVSSKSFLPSACDRITDVLGQLQLPLTVFVVGRDLADDDDAAAVSQMARVHRYELGNHSLHHEPWLHTYSAAQLQEELGETHQRIAAVSGQQPTGFRGPGFSCSETVLETLIGLGYQYDASVFGTSLAPLARLYYFAKTGLRGKDRQQRGKLYGDWKAFLQPNKPFRRRVGSAGYLWEIPVTVLPVARVPIHFTYLMFLGSKLGPSMAVMYLRQALWWCRLCRVPPSLLLHPTDFLGQEDAPDMAFFPGMSMPRKAKLELVTRLLRTLGERFDVRTMADQVASLDPNANTSTTSQPRYANQSTQGAAPQLAPPSSAHRS